jgi:hypothetical protein
VRLARLADNQIGASGVDALAAALPQMPSLTTLHLYSTATRACLRVPVDEACASVPRGQLAPCASAFGRMFGCGHRALGSERTVRHARLAENQIGASGVDALAAVLPQMPSLTTLYLSGTAAVCVAASCCLGLAHRWCASRSCHVLRRTGAGSDVGGGL